MASEVRKSGIHQISQKLYFNNVSLYSEQSRTSLKSRKSLHSRQSFSEDMNQFLDAHSRVLERQSQVDSVNQNSSNSSDSSEDSEDEVNEASFMSCRVPGSMNNSISIEQPRRISAARTQDYPPDDTPPTK